MTPSPAEHTFYRSVAPRGSLYAIVDAARDPNGVYEARLSDVRTQSLFEGRLGERLENVAPHLVELRRNTAFARWWFEQWGRSVGVMAEAGVGFDELRRHFRTILMVRGEGHKRYYFRFYDPRVLPSFLPSCTAPEVEEFYGPISAFYCEGAGGQELLTFKPGGENVVIKTTTVKRE